MTSLCETAHGDDNYAIAYFASDLKNPMRLEILNEYVRYLLKYGGGSGCYGFTCSVSCPCKSTECIAALGSPSTWPWVLSTRAPGILRPGIPPDSAFNSWDFYSDPL